jgi:hypothetical protein
LQEGHKFNYKRQNVEFLLRKRVKEKNGNDEHETKPNIKPLKSVKTKTESYFCKKKQPKPNWNQIPIFKNKNSN